MAPVAPVAPSAGGNLIYSFVAVVKGSKGDKEDKGEPVVLAEHAAFAGNFKDIALECLKQVVANLGQEVDGQKKVFIPHEQHTFSFLFDDGYAFVCLSDADVLREISSGFLEMLKDEFMAKYKASGRTMKPLALNKAFGSKIKSTMEHVKNNPGEVSKLAKIKAQATEIKGIMRDNIEKVLKRGEKLEVLGQQASELADNAKLFRKSAKEVETKMWWQNIQVKIVFIVLFAIILLGIFFSVCGTLHCF